MMDTSVEYILMCEKAEEIQELWKPRAGDWYKYHSGWCEEAICVYPGERQNQYLNNPPLCPNARCPKGHRQYIWLARQDQLQEMLGNYDDALWTMAEYVMFIEGESDDEAMRVVHNDGHWKSMEQLWLAFVMYDKYGKRWNGTDWAEEKATLQTVGVGHTVK